LSVCQLDAFYAYSVDLTLIFIKKNGQPQSLPLTLSQPVERWGCVR